MTIPINTDDADRNKRFTAAINRNGYAFQNALLKYMGKLYADRKSKWRFEAAEFPVEIRGHDTRIDFVLTVPDAPTVWLLAECKRVSPAYSDWCFWQTPYVRMNHRNDMYIAECVQLGGTASGIYVKRSANIYNQGLSVKTKPDNSQEQKTSDDAIEKAASQICKGMNGMANFLRANDRFLTPTGTVVLLPVIFTTARLWVCNTDLSQADLASGNIDPAIVEYKEVTSVLYQYVISPGIRHDLFPASQETRSLSSTLAACSLRTVAIVNPEGVEDFLSEVSPEWLQNILIS